MEFPLYFWVCFVVFVALVMVLDLGVLHKKPHALSLRESVTMIGIWVLSASLFCTITYFYAGKTVALEFITGYIVELALSMDNVFVFFIIFTYLGIPLRYQHKVLFWGVLGAVVMRLIMITGGIYILQHLTWIFYIFGILLILSAVKVWSMDLHKEVTGDSVKFISNILRRFGSVTHELHGEKFIVRSPSGKRQFTPLFVALILIEKVDLIFALDSIPAILAITQNTYIVFTSNIFAILGLRAMYFMLSHLVNRFVYLKHGLALILVFIGCKMLLSMQGIHIAIEYSLLFVLSTLSLCMLLSWFIGYRNIQQK